MYILSSWFRWFVLGSLFFAAIGFAEPGNENPPSDGESTAIPAIPSGSLPPQWPLRAPIQNDEILVQIDPAVRKQLSDAELQAVVGEIGKLFDGHYTYKPGTMEAVPSTRFPAGTDQIQVEVGPVIAPQEELDLSVQAYEDREGSLRWTPEIKEEFYSKTTITYPSARFPGLNHIFKVSARFGRLLYTGSETLAVSFHKNVQNGIHELVINVPDRLWGKDKASVRQASVDIFSNVRTILSQTLGLNEKVPAFSAGEIEVISKSLQEHAIVSKQLDYAARGVFKGDDEEVNIYQVALVDAETQWDTKGKEEALVRVNSRLSSIQNERGLSRRTRETLLPLMMETEEKAFITKSLLESPELQKAAIEMEADVRLYDTELMGAVEGRVRELEASFEKQWENVRSTIASQIYSELFAQFGDDYEGLIRATVEKLQRVKQDQFYGVLINDSGLDLVHPRSKGIGKLLVEKGQAETLVYEKEQEFIQSLLARKEEFKQEISYSNPIAFIQSFSAQDLERKVLARLDQEFLKNRDERYKEIVLALAQAGHRNVAQMLGNALVASTEPSRLETRVANQQIPARAMSWQMTALKPSEWTKFSTTDGKWSGTPEFTSWVDSTQTLWRVQGWWKATAAAYRKARKVMFQDFFLKGPFGLQALYKAEPFHYLEMVDADTGKVVLDQSKKRSTWLSNMKSIWNWGTGVATSEHPGIVPKVLWRVGTGAFALVATPTAMALGTAARLTATAATATATAVTGSNIAAGIIGPAYAFVKYGLKIGVRDVDRPIPAYGKRISNMDPETKARYEAKLKWLTLGGPVVGLLAGGALEWNQLLSLSWSWLDLAKDVGYYGSYGVGTGLTLAGLAALGERGWFALPNQLLTGFTYPMERLSAAVSIAPAKEAGMAAIHGLGLGVGMNGAELVRNLAVRYVLMELILDRAFTFLGGSGVTIPRRNSIFMHQVKGPGVASQHFYGLSHDMAVAALFGKFETIDLANWQERRSKEAAEPRNEFLRTEKARLIALTGKAGIENTPAGKLFDAVETKDQAYRGEEARKRFKLLEPLLSTTATLQGKVRFTQEQLTKLRTEATALTKTYFDTLVSYDRNGTQRAALWSSRGVKQGDWQTLADRLLEETFGVGVLQPLEGVDQASYTTVESIGWDGIVQQLVAGQDLDVSDTVTVKPVPDAVLDATASVPFMGTRAICSRELLKAVPTPWTTAAK